MKTLVFLIFFIASSVGHTIALIEPSLSLGQASGDSIANSTNQTLEGSATVANFGLRYGVARKYVHLTGIFEGNFIQSDGQDMQFVPMAGVGLGWEWNLPLRTYIIMAAYGLTDDQAGMGAELSYEFSKNFWVGLRFMQVRGVVREVRNNAEVDATLKLDNIALTMSFPFEFNYPETWFKESYDY